VRMTRLVVDALQHAVLKRDEVARRIGQIVTALSQ
jgi:hypothetical protein